MSLFGTLASLSSPSAGVGGPALAQGGASGRAGAQMTFDEYLSQQTTPDGGSSDDGSVDVPGGVIGWRMPTCRTMSTSTWTMSA